MIVSDDQIEAARVSAKHLQSRGRVGERLGVVAQPLQHPDGQVREQRFVIEIQDALPGSGLESLRIRTLHIDLSFDGREVELESRPAAGLAGDSDRAVMRLRDAMRQGMPVMAQK